VEERDAEERWWDAPTYILDGTQPVPCPDRLRWARWLEKADRQVAQTTVAPEVEVITLFLGIDPNFSGQGLPLLFRSFVCGGPLAGEQDSYPTWHEATQGHEALCDRLRAARTGWRIWRRWWWRPWVRRPADGPARL
jgi:hypothetical protein